MNEDVRKELEQRLGWLCAELGKEDAKIFRLKEELANRTGRRKALEEAVERISKMIELK